MQCKYLDKIARMQLQLDLRQSRLAPGACMSFVVLVHFAFLYDSDLIRYRYLVKYKTFS